MTTGYKPVGSPGVGLRLTREKAPPRVPSGCRGGRRWVGPFLHPGGRGDLAAVIRVNPKDLSRGGDMKREVIKTERAPKAIGPYEQALKLDGWVFTSGQIPLDPKSGTMVEGGIGAQTQQVLENLRRVLEAAGTSMNRVVKATVYMTNLADF